MPATLAAYWQTWAVAGLSPEEMGRSIPMRRTGTPDEMAAFRAALHTVGEEMTA